jgi:hypothetical protein
MATMTRRFVDALDGTSTKILDTRKTTPGWRALEKAAVKAGGGENHRAGLYDMVIIKENHAAIAGGITEAVTASQGPEHPRPGHHRGGALRWRTSTRPSPQASNASCWTTWTPRTMATIVRNLRKRRSGPSWRRPAT